MDIQQHDIVVASACLLGCKCKYNGKDNADARVQALASTHTVIAVCPEQLGGLPTPRPCAELVDGRVRTADMADVHQQFTQGAQAALEQAIAAHATVAILQPRSPSCGVHQIYDGSFSGKLIEGKGIFATLLEQAGIPAIEPDDLE